MKTRDRSNIALEAARIVCEELLTDYRAAKHKAAERLGLPPRAPMPDNREVQQAVLEYQRLFGGAAYGEHLRRMRGTAVRAMKLLSGFSPRLVGCVVSGAVTAAHRVQLHAFSDKPEALDLFLHDRGIAFQQDERSYRFPDGHEERIPLANFEADGIGIDVAMFDTGEIPRPPINPADGQQYKRLDLAGAERLAAATIERV